MKYFIKIILSNLLIVPILMVGTSANSDVLLDQSNMKYLGAFKVPWTRQGCDNWTDCVFGYGGETLAFSPTGDNGNGSLYLGGNIQGQRVAEINIPVLVNSNTQDNLNEAVVLQYFFDTTEGNQNNVLANGAPYSQTVYKGGLMVWGSKLIGTVYAYYPGVEVQILSHYTSGLNLSATGDFSGMYRVGNVDGQARSMAGYMCEIPTEWRSSFGGPALTGQAGLPVISTTSSGPSAFVFNPDDLGITIPAPATPLVTYPITHPLADPATQNTLFNVTSTIRGVVFPSGTASILFIGRHGLGEYCYGEQDLNPASPCYDPIDSAKGPHMYPYESQIWAYSTTELLRVKNGTIASWEARPYAVWNFHLPFDPGNGQINGVSYDKNTRRIYMSQQDALGRPVIHVFEVTLFQANFPIIQKIQ